MSAIISNTDDERYAAEKLVLAGRVIRSKNHSQVPIGISFMVLDKWRPDHEPSISIDGAAVELRRKRRSIKRAIHYLITEGFFTVVEETPANVVLRPNFAMVAEEAARKREQHDEPPAEDCIAFREAA